MHLLRLLYKVWKSIPLPAFSFIRQLMFGTEPIPKTSLRSLPNEHLLKIFAFLELKPYIICHDICKDWRQFLPLTKLHPIRSRLLALYRRFLDTPDFDKAFEWTNKNLQSLDREEYICSLLAQYPTVPEAFRMWILEWSTRLVIQCTWPGLPFIRCQTNLPILPRGGVNWVAYRSSSRKLSAFIYRRKTPWQTFIPWLFIWYDATETDWLIFGQKESKIFGRVFRVDSYHYCAGSIPYYPRREDIEDNVDNDPGTNSGSSRSEDINDDVDEDTDVESESSDGEKRPAIFDDWIAYLDFLWSDTVEEIRCPGKTFTSISIQIH